MELPSQQICRIYVVSGTALPKVPEHMQAFVRIALDNNRARTEVEQQFSQDYNVFEWDCWLITGAVAGFTGNGSVRLNSNKYGLCIKWLKNSRKVYGIQDYGPIRANYRLCRECGKIMGESRTNSHAGEEFFDHDHGISLLEFHCMNCGHRWEVDKTDGRPRPNRHRPPSKDYKLPFVICNRSHKTRIFR